MPGLGFEVAARSERRKIKNGRKKKQVKPRRQRRKELRDRIKSSKADKK